VLLAAILGLALAAQDDVGPLLEKLRGDDSFQRDAAQRALERMGLPALEPLQAALGKETDLETKLRLKTLLERIPRLAQLAKVYGPTKRVKARARDERLRVVLENLGGLSGEKIYSEGVDLNATVTVDFPDVTLWEALDRVAHAAKAHYHYRKDGIAFRPGEAPAFPVVYYEQFRISVAEVKRVEYRSPDYKGGFAAVMVEVQFQRNLTPTGERYRKIFSIDAVTGPDGAEARKERPWYASGVVARREYALEEDYTVDASVGSFTIAGKATINFAQEHREFVLPLDGEKKEESSADGTFKVGSLKPEDGKLVVGLEIEVPEAGGPDTRFRGVWVVDADGKRHSGTILTMGRDGKSFRPKVWFPVAPDAAKSVVFKWALGLHSVEVPFALKDIPVPAP
jgi:hypothetical protein